MDRTTRIQLLDLIARIRSGDGEDNVVGDWIETIERATRNPHAMDILTSGHYDHLSDEELLEKMCEYRPIITPPPA